MAKAKPKATTAWIRYRQAKALASEYLGDPEVVEDEIRNDLAAGEIPWRCVRFKTPPQYSGSGSGDPEFWKFEGQQRTRDGSTVIETWRDIYTEGDSATRTDDAAAYGIDLDRDALIRRGLLPPEDVAGDSVARIRAPGVASLAPKKGNAWQVDRILRAIPEVFPGGIDEIPNSVVRKEVEKYLQPKIKTKGLAVPSPDSFDRALRLYRTRQ